MMLVGALFLSLNIAPTEEAVQVAWTMTPLHGLGLLVLTIAVDARLRLRARHRRRPRVPWWSLLLRFTLVGYALALAISLYVLWTFGRTDGVGAARS